MRRLAQTLAALIVATVGLFVVMVAPAAAHPLGNFTSNTYAGVRVRTDRIAIDYVLDLAEIPTQQAMPTIDTDGDGTVSPSEQATYEHTMCASLASGLQVTVDDRAVAVQSSGGRLSFPPGLAGLSILRLECDLSAPIGGLGRVAVHDGNLSDRIGWHEVTAIGDGTTLSGSTVASVSSSRRLTAYPSGVPSLNVRDAAFLAHAGGAAAPSADNAPATEHAVPGGDRATELFASLVSDHHLSLGFGLLALLVAVVLGGFHALAPGHGKTVMAAYIIGRRGGMRQAMGIGLTVAVTHTTGVLILGLLLWSSQTLSADRLYPVLGVASGLLVAAVGLSLLVRVVRNGRPAPGHQHGTGPGQHTHAWIPELELALVGAGAPVPEQHVHHDHHGHDHHDHAHHDHDHAHHGHEHHDHAHHDRDHDHDHHHDAPAVAVPEAPGWKSIVAMGLAGGMVPSPSAVIVLLGALALGRAWFGVLLVVAYGIGLALTLLLAGLLLARAQHWLEPRLQRREAMLRWFALLPVITAVAVFGGGLVLAARAASLI